jgi:hypothetical protein
VPPPNFSANSSSNSKVRCKACNKLTFETLEIRQKNRCVFSSTQISFSSVTCEAMPVIHHLVTYQQQGPNIWLFL